MCALACAGACHGTIMFKIGCLKTTACGRKTRTKSINCSKYFSINRFQKSLRIRTLIIIIIIMIIIMIIIIMIIIIMIIIITTTTTTNNNNNLYFTRVTQSNTDCEFRCCVVSVAAAGIIFFIILFSTDMSRQYNIIFPIGFTTI